MVSEKQGYTMKTIGLLGGMSWESTMGYYRMINQGVNRALGELHSARTVLYSVDFEPISKLQHEGNWEGAAETLVRVAVSIQSAGADFLVICTNTMHKVAPQIEDAIDIPLLHIADGTAETLLENGIETVGLLGTSFTMEQDFYRGRLEDKFGLNVIVPDKRDRDLVHRVIYDELCQGQIESDSKAEFFRIIDLLEGKGVEGVILGCTEIGMLIKQNDTGVRLFDTTVIHAGKAVERALE